MTGRVMGAGGVFFRAKDPAALAEWYRTHFAIDANGPWPQEAGFAVLGLFAQDSDYWPADRAFMVNFRVDDLDEMRAGLEAAGVAVETNPAWDMPEIGRFARVYDPEGNPIELWEPAREAR
ncbi:VOC family protein [Ovoidimarina sediminis]|uniref:VOC family protein n=1 Tax=Ovoidimarina sediminis TaxID=3079856 RepID=UPI00290D5D52|nr:VOC family protein [Rhodophyticola sp. MJ-SS7]MDU8942303.1 VOC family protein [Rhodophyticola sp. MJ-SS7]